MSATKKVIVSCALNGVLTDPKTYKIPVTPKEMATSAKEAFDAGATIVHCHFRDQREGQGALPSWDPNVAVEIIQAIRESTPELIINMSTGVPGPDIKGPLSCLKSSKPEIAALNSGSLNYLKIKQSGEWAWKPFLFDNPVSKIEEYLKTMRELCILPECECFDTGIVRSVAMFEKAGLLVSPVNISLVMGVSSGMPSNPDLLPILLQELSPEAHWQVIAIGKQEIWRLYQRAIELGGNVRTGLEDTFYLESGEKTTSNGALVENLVQLVKRVGRQVASPQETREILKI